MIVENHRCLQCNNTEDKQIVNNKIMCYFCNTSNDIWQTRFSISFLRHFVKYLKNEIIYGRR